ncbi:MerR family transcriptional regulator [Actinoplanes sp. NPDC051494]|uniref:MerR family transcriptional regulator n=1 Tax=Actinoplanes sp. NPDC051494 TaxID=3363907 RepID=UPI0037AEA753
MDLVTIGAFARAARLSPKALRLYDELGLLPPAAVDSETGYRYYDLAQLDRARLLAWLRRLEMPLARIRAIAEMPGAEAATAVRRFMAEAAAELAARDRLATFVTDYLTGKGAPMSEHNPTLGLRFATGCSIGKVRDTDQDQAWAGSTLLAVADGAGPGGDRAAAAAIEAFRAATPASSPLGVLERGMQDADAAVRVLSGGDGDEQAITTLTAMVWSGSRVGVAHIGDSRAYLLRGGELSRFTDDHSYVQQLVDTGALRADEAAGHPQRPLLVRALGSSGEADLSLRTALAGDRYLLCTDGLWTVVPELAGLLAGGDPQHAVDRLIAAAYEAGAPDNIGCVVADVVPV